MFVTKTYFQNKYGITIEITYTTINIINSGYLKKLNVINQHRNWVIGLAPEI